MSTEPSLQRQATVTLMKYAYGATAADIKVVADSEVSKVQIGDSEFKGKVKILKQ